MVPLRYLIVQLAVLPLFIIDRVLYPEGLWLLDDQYMSLF